MTWLAQDPSRSAEASSARDVTVHHGSAEEILAFAPDLVLANEFSDPVALSLLRRVGIPVAILREPTDYAGIVANVRRVAQLLGNAARGEEVVADIEAKLRPAASGPGLRPVVAVVEQGGYTQGMGTLLDDAITKAGGIGLGRRLGLRGYAVLPLERLVAAKVDLVARIGGGAEAPSLGGALLAHPALASRFADTPRLSVPANLTECAAPRSADLVPALRAALAGSR